MVGVSLGTDDYNDSGLSWGSRAVWVSCGGFYGSLVFKSRFHLCRVVSSALRFDSRSAFWFVPFKALESGAVSITYNR